MDLLKLVIWDLDETFWRGTLSEGGVTQVDAHLRIIEELNRRGIVNSICSRNDPHQAKEELQRQGIWEAFVFPHIDWAPKGPSIHMLLSDIGLRAENALFIDDNHLNLKEVEHYNPGITVWDAAKIERLLGHPAAAGKDDSEQSRLRQYKILERKLGERGRSGAGNLDFLRLSQIIVSVSRACEQHVDRLLELINRSNQLNFTKQRLSKPELNALLDDSRTETGYIQVQDRFGDYGISGFFALREGQLEHFVFSCRILDMGVASWVHHELGQPSVKIVQPVAENLIHVRPDWINATPNVSEREDPVIPGTRPRRPIRMFLKGGCDLSQLRTYLGPDVAVHEEFTTKTALGFPVHTEHTEILKRCNRNTVRDYGEVLDRLTFLDREAYQSEYLGRGRTQIYVYSPLMDYTQGLYRYRDSTLLVPYLDFLTDVTQDRHWDRLIESKGAQGLSREFLGWFADNFVFEGRLPLDFLRRNLIWLRNQLPADSDLILLNGVEVPFPHPFEPDRHLHHQQCNEVISQVVLDLERTHLCDVSKIVNSRDQMTDNIRHYNRHTYFDIAAELRFMAGNLLEWTTPLRFVAATPARQPDKRPRFWNWVRNLMR